jgi:hypothetical protein
MHETHTLRDRQFATGLHGVVYPSFMSPGGTCVALWRWNEDNATRLDIVDPDHPAEAADVMALGQFRAACFGEHTRVHFLQPLWPAVVGQGPVYVRWPRSGKGRHRFEQHASGVSSKRRSVPAPHPLASGLHWAR